MIARSRPSRSPKWYCSDVVLRCCASRLISRNDTPSMPRAANSRSAAAISDSGASGDVPLGALAIDGDHNGDCGAGSDRARRRSAPRTGG